MKRFLLEELKRWKSKRNRKPLILNGARQVGKTWLLREFGRTCFDSVAYISLDNNVAARTLFDDDFDVQRIITGLSLLADVKIEPGKTLIILDEIQSAPHALTALKYFCENAPEYVVAAAGSLLGLTVHEGSGYPVGKVDTLELYPLNFVEFLEAAGQERLANVVLSDDEVLINAVSDRLISQLKTYYIIGGMPAVVSNFIQTFDFDSSREIQSQILLDYERDFAKHIPSAYIQRTLEVWHSIPAHLSQENKRFVFGHIRSGARASQYDEALLWLENAGLIYRVKRISKPALPLGAYAEANFYKVFLLDVGLLCAMSQLDPSTILEGSTIYTEFRGAFTEQYVCQQLISQCGLTPYYWSADNSRGEIDFIVQRGNAIYPIEVKAEENLRAKSLRAFSQRYPQVEPIRTSLSPFRREDWMRNVPLYALHAV
ncbi:ATP-binding protein [Alloscardovia venturai]|uniref:ATP-binding protein n=1 Tax=Alloscardovia venturai TaxID=1769421 RepID=A0ABW2Y2E7_9BIFI